MKVRLAWVIALLMCGVGHASADARRDDLALLARSMHALDAADEQAADGILQGLSARGRELPEAAFQRGLVDFHLGRYAEGAREIERAVAAAPKSPHLTEWRTILSWVQAARDITHDFVQASSDHGRYVVYHEKGVDQVLVSYALDTLARADQALERHLGFHMVGPIRLEIYPSADSLARVSSLTLENIETSGTVALCKWNRIMIASPRSLLYGYPWLDTINHEFVHLALTRASRHQAPVWFHEGLAKLYERTWRGVSPGSYLPPSTSGLLTEAARDQKLIPFDRMHPSIAMLPSQEEAALAFAQVVTFLESFRKAYADAGLSRAVAAIAQGRDARRSLAEVAGSEFAELERAWQRGLRGRSDEPKPREIKRRFVRGTKDADESLDVPVERARKHLRIGDMLWSRGHLRAAGSEYARARTFAVGDPILASRVARAALHAERPAEAITALEPALGSHPTHAPLHSLRGEALLALGDVRPGLAALREALRLNPFDPFPHCQLAALSADDAEKRRERAACVLVGGPPAPRQRVGSVP
jgi:tetratricopeptide (TPR) repeat protein